MKPILSLAMLLLGMATAVAQAATPILGGSLGRWVDETAAPELADLFSRHPRFKGETVHFVTLQDGIPQPGSNELNRAIERQLTRRLLEVEGVKVALATTAKACSAPQPVNYLVGVEVQTSGAREHQVSIALIDTAESVWVSGVSLQWHGRLATSEQLALVSGVDSAAPGSAQSPLPVAAADRIAAAMTERLRCSLPKGIDGPVFVQSPDNPALTRLTLALQGKLMVTPLAAITPARETAAWYLSMDSRPAGSGMSELQLVLSGRDGQPPQRVAALFVTGVPPAHQVAQAPDATPTAPASAPSAPASTVPGSPGLAPLLTALELQPATRSGICDDTHARANSCTEVTFQLLEPAYLLVFSTQDQSLGGVACAGRLQREQAGERRFRLRVPPTANGLRPYAERPDAGFYALAVRDRTLALKLDRLLKSAPGACHGTNAPGSLHEWLTNLQQVVAAQGDRLDWRAVHTSHGPDGISRL